MEFVHLMFAAVAGGIGGSTVTLAIVGRAGVFTRRASGQEARSDAVARVVSAVNVLVNEEAMDVGAAVRSLASAHAVASVYTVGRLAPLYHLGDALVDYAKDLPVSSGAVRADLLAELLRARDDYLAGVRRALADN